MNSLTLAEKRISSLPTPILTRADNPFKRYKGFEGHAVRRAKVTGSFAKIGEAWANWTDSINRRFNVVQIEKWYDSAVSVLEGITIHSRDVERFNLFLIAYQDYQYFQLLSGLFLSALINSSQDTNFTIETKHFSQSDYPPAIYCLGYRNTKNIIIKETAVFLGGIGDEMQSGTIEVSSTVHSVGMKMKGGKIVVNANVLHYVASEMEGGEVIINGNVGGGKLLHVSGDIIDDGIVIFVGAGMTNGNIIIRGNADGEIGYNMKDGGIRVVGNVCREGYAFPSMIGSQASGGVIHIDGNIGRFSSWPGECKIYNKGKLIWPNL